MKTKEELTALRNEVEALNRKLSELNGDELNLVVGGYIPPYYKDGFTVEEGAETVPFDCSGYFFKLSHDGMPMESEQE